MKAKSDLNIAESRKKIFWINCFIVIIVAFNLRAPITSIGPILKTIQEYYDLNSAMAGLLITLPLIAFGGVSFIVTYFPPIRAIVLGLILIVCGEILRSASGTLGLFMGMALLGVGIAIANVLLPSFIKEKFPTKAAPMMSLYSLILNVSSICGITLGLPLLSILPLQYALLFWLSFACIALLAYYPHTRNGRIFHVKKKPSHTINLFKHSTAWKVTLFMGMQSFIAYSIFTWFAVIITNKGYTQEFGAKVLLISQIAAIPVSLFGPLFLGSMRNIYKAPYMASLCGCYIVAFLLLLRFDSEMYLFIAAILIGIPMGGVFGIALLFISLKSENAFIASKLSSMSQGFGYLIAASAPFIIGFLHDYFESFYESLILLVCVSCGVSILGLLTYKSPVITAKTC